MKKLFLTLDSSQKFVDVNGTEERRVIQLALVSIMVLTPCNFDQPIFISGYQKPQDLKSLK